MKKAVITALVVASSVGGFFFVTDTDHRVSRPIETIVALGDSLTQGYGSSEGNDYVSRLERMINKKIINMGVGGDTSAGVIRRLDTVIEAQPDMVLLFIGGNDLLRRVSNKELFINLEIIIQTLQADGITVVLIGVPGGLITDPLDDEFEALAERYDLTYIPEFMGELIRTRTYMYDGVHPNDDGYAIVAERIYQGIQLLVK